MEDSKTDLRGKFTYVLTTYPPPQPTQFASGDDVWVLTAKKALFEPGVVQSFDNDSSSPFCGRYQVRYNSDGSKYHVRPNRLLRIERVCVDCNGVAQKLVIVCDETRDYRRMARVQTCPEDRVLEIGSSFGLTTSLIAEACPQGSVVGVDKSSECVERSRQTYPHIRFEQIDILKNEEALRTLVASCNKVFVDINGNRELPTVLRLLSLLQAVGPDVIVVKSRALHRQTLKGKPIRTDASACCDSAAPCADDALAPDTCS